MSHPIWPVVTENLAEQLSAAQSGIVHPTQLLPYLPLSLSLIEQTLDPLCESDRVEKCVSNGLAAYIFKESVDRPPHKFALEHCVYSNDPLDDYAFSAVSPAVRSSIEAELASLAQHDPWPAEAVHEHELLYLANNLPAPVHTSAIAGHSRLPFKNVELHLAQLQRRQALLPLPELNSWQLPPLRYPKPAYQRNVDFIRQFPGAIKEELELRLIKALSYALLVLFVCALLALVARVPFPFILATGLASAAVIFFKVFKAAPKPIPEIQ